MVRSSYRVALAGLVAVLVAACSLTTSLSGYAGPPESTEGGPGSGGIEGGGDGAPGVAADAADAADAPAPQYAATVLADSPIVYYRLGEGSTTGPAKDRSPSARDAVFQGKVTTGVPGAIVNDPDTACRFDGTTSAVVLAGGPTFAGKVAYSVEAWVRPTSLAGPNGHVVVACEKDPNDGYALFFYLDAKPHLERENGAGNDGLTGTLLSSTGFAHVVGTFDGTTQRLYLDGVLVDSAPSSKPIPGASGVPFAIGASDNADANRFQGDIDEVAIYDHILTPERIRVHHKVGSGNGP